MKDTVYSIGIDIGGTKIKYGIVKLSHGKADIITSSSINTICGKNNKNIVINTIVEIINELCQKEKKISCIGIGVAALVDSNFGKIIMAPNLQWWNVDLKKILKKHTSLPIVIDNDANIAAIGIYYLELHKKYKNVVCFTLGTGIGGGIIINGEIYRGSIGTAGELGHMTLFPNGEKCNCGNYGCLERYIGSYWFIKNVIEKLKKRKDSIIYDLTGNNLSNLTPEILYHAAEKKDKFAIEQWELYGEYLGIAVSNVINILNPQLIVFSGGVAKAYKYFLPKLKTTVNSRVWPAANISSNYSDVDTSYSKNSMLLPSKNVKFFISSNPENLGIFGAGIVAIKTVKL